MDQTTDLYRDLNLPVFSHLSSNHIQSHKVIIIKYLQFSNIGIYLAVRKSHIEAGFTQY